MKAPAKYAATIYVRSAETNALLETVDRATAKRLFEEGGYSWVGSTRRCTTLYKLTSDQRKLAQIPSTGWKTSYLQRSEKMPHGVWTHVSAASLYLPSPHKVKELPT